MARARNIKPAIMDNEELAELGPLTRLLFIYLWMLADREGRLEDRPKRIAAQALAYDRAADVPAMLDDLQCHGFIKRYVSGGVACIQITGFSKHQTPHGTEKNSALPNADGALTVHKRGKNGYATGDFELVNGFLTVKKQDENTLIPDSGYLIPDLLIPDLLIADIAPAVLSPAASPQPAHQKGAATPATKKSRASLATPDGVSPSTWADFMKLRMAKKAPITQTALDGIQREADKAGVTLEVAVATCCEAGWQSFNAEWYFSRIATASPKSMSSEPGWRRDARERMQAAVPNIAEKSPHRPTHEFFEVKAKNVTSLRLD